MPWIIGIDEAGYGPNLGPFVMTSVACRVPPELAAADLWQALRAAVRRHSDRCRRPLRAADGGCRTLAPGRRTNETCQRRARAVSPPARDP